MSPRSRLLIKMSEDHRISSYSERLCMQEIGKPLKDGETRLCGLNLGWMLEEKFLKQQEARFSSEPYTSEVVHIHQASKGFPLLARARERYTADTENLAEKIGNFLLNEAKTQRTKGNTSVIFLDFDTMNRIPSCKLEEEAIICSLKLLKVCLDLGKEDEVKYKV
ncbi:unnamed protein product [Camellia sinensis]